MSVPCASRSRSLLAVLVLVVASGPLRAVADVTENDYVVFDNRFGDQTGPISIGSETYTEVVPEQRFMYSIQTAFESFSASQYSTTADITFPDSVIPHIPDAYSGIMQIVGNVIQIDVPQHAGLGVRIPFDVKSEDELDPSATEIHMLTHIAVVTPSNGTLQNTTDDSLTLKRASAFTASATATPAEVQLEDSAPTITVTVTLTNTGAAPLSAVKPSGDPTPSNPAAVEKASGPTPASVDLAAGASKTVTYTYTAKQGGKVRFSFAGFTAQGPSGTVGIGGTQTADVTIKEDVDIKVSVDPGSIATDSSAASGAVVRLKVTNKKGEAVSGQHVALDFPQYVNVIDLNPRLLICKPDGTRVFPPGDNPTLNDAAYGVTPAGGELAFQLWLGTQRRSTQLLVSGAAVDANNLEVASNAAFVDLPETGQTPTADVSETFNTLQRADLPAGQQDDSAGITGSGTPQAVLESLVRWLLAKRDAGVAEVRAVDFVPITSADQTFAGLLVYSRARLQEVLAHFDGGPAVADAYVLQIERAGLLASSNEVKWLRPALPLDTWENVPLNADGLPENGVGTPARGRAVPVVNVATDSPYAWLGYPYPSGGAAASGGYGGGCVPTTTGVGAELHSPVTLLVKNAQGQRLGFDAGGAYVDEIPGAVFSGGEPSKYLLPAGTYTADLVGTGKGAATVVLSAAGVAPKTITLKAKSGKTGTLAFDQTLAGTAGTFNKRKLKIADGVPITIGGVKKKLKVHAGDVLNVAVKNPFGAGVAGARVHVVGTGIDVEAVTAADGVGSVPLAVSKATKKLTVTVDGAGVQAKVLKVRLKVLGG